MNRSRAILFGACCFTAVFALRVFSTTLSIFDPPVEPVWLGVDILTIILFGVVAGLGWVKWVRRRRAEQ